MSMAGNGKIIDNKGLTYKKKADFSEWYSEVVQKAELVDYAPIKGFMIIKPNGYSIWEKIQEEFNAFLKKRGIRNAYFPLLIPESYFKREAEHAQGFAPELAYLEGKEEGERLALRPTSETIVYDSFSKWIRSWRDLPYRINQWANVLRWEVKQTKPFIRTREFLWQEGHCAFSSEKDAERNVDEIIREYRKVAEELMGIPVILGRKSKMETFAGAKKTMTIEGLMPDGTSHNLGQGFSKAFDVKFRNKDEGDEFAWLTSWGISTRLIGALAMTHGDDKGLVLPPKIAFYKGVVIPIIFDETKEKVIQKVKDIEKRLLRYNFLLDDREEYSPGWKFSEWEMKGIPIRIEVGPKDLEKKQVTLVRRDTGLKEQIKEKDLEKKVSIILEDMQKNLFEKARKFLDSRIDSAKDLKELKKKIEEGKIVKVYMDDDILVEGKVKNETGATSRIIEDVKKEGKCVISGKSVKTIAYVARSY